MTAITASSQKILISSVLFPICFKGAFLILSFLSLLISVSVYADEAPVKIQTQTPTDKKQSKQPDSLQSSQQNKISEEKPKYSFLSNQLLTNTVSTKAIKETSANSDALSVTLGLIVILMMIFSLAWFMKKMGYSNVTGQGQLKIIASLNLGQKEKIALIQVGKQQLLVGMTATQINTLHVLDEALEETEIKQSGIKGHETFSSKLTEFLKHKT